MNKKIILVIIVLMVFSLTLNVNALDISTVNASQSNGVITVSGTTEDDVLAASVYIFDNNDTLIINKNIAVDNKAYSTTFNLPEGNYKVKVADYNGGTFKEATLSSSSNDNNSNNDTSNTTDESTSKKLANATNPDTSDHVLKYIILGIIGLSGLLSSSIVLKKMNK